MKIRHVSEEELRSLIPFAALASFSPNVVVAVERGGIVPAKMISNELGVALSTVRSTLYNDDKPARKIHDAPKVDLHGANFSGKKVLVVDDVCNSGATLNAVKAAILASGASEVRTFSLFGKSDFSDRPFEGCVRFPWEG